MLSPIVIRNDWHNRQEYIKILDIPFTGKQIKYLISVLFYINSRIKPYNWVLKDQKVLYQIKDGYKHGIVYYKLAREIINENNTILGEL